MLTLFIEELTANILKELKGNFDKFRARSKIAKDVRSLSPGLTKVLFVIKSFLTTFCCNEDRNHAVEV